MDFGKYAILQPVTHNLEKEPQWWWKINPPTAVAELEVARLLSTERKRTEFDGTQISVVTTTIELAMREIAVTFGGTNIPLPDNQNKPILPDNASPQQVEAVLSVMPRELILELWEAVGEACPGWGPVVRRRKAVSESADGEEKKAQTT